MSKVYTKSGDDGYTSLVGGKRVKKSADIVELYGALDELNVFLSSSIESLCHNRDYDNLLKQIYRIQKEIFALGSHLVSGERFTISSQSINKLEDEIDGMSENLPILKSFILPSGGESAVRLHMARVVCRRAERVAFKLADDNHIAEIAGVYLNRLADWLYTAARTAALIVNIEEVSIVD